MPSFHICVYIATVASAVPVHKQVLWPLLTAIAQIHSFFSSLFIIHWVLCIAYLHQAYQCQLLRQLGGMCLHSKVHMLMAQQQNCTPALDNLDSLLLV